MANRTHLGSVTTYNRVFDENTLSWIAMVQPSTAAAGGAGSTQVTVSNFSTVVAMRPTDTNVAANAGFHFDALGNLLTVGLISGASTIVAVSNFPVQSTQVAVSNFPVQSTQVSIGTPLVVRSTNSVAADLQMTATPFAGSTWNVRASCSSATDFKTTVTPDSSNWTIQSRNTDSTGGGIVGSTKALNVGANGLIVRQGSVDSTTFSGQCSSAETQVLSSAATAIYVYAYCLSLLSTAAQLLRFMNGSTVECWRVRVQGGSTTGQMFMTSEMAVSPPAYLFRTAAGNPLLLSATSSGTNVSVAAWRE